MISLTILVEACKFLGSSIGSGNLVKSGLTYGDGHMPTYMIS